MQIYGTRKIRTAKKWYMQVDKIKNNLYKMWKTTKNIDNKFTQRNNTINMEIHENVDSDPHIIAGKYYILR